MGLWKGEWLAPGCAWWGQYLNLALTDYTPALLTMPLCCESAAGQGRPGGLTDAKWNPGRLIIGQSAHTGLLCLPPLPHNTPFTLSTTVTVPVLGQAAAWAAWKLELLPLFRWCELLLVLRGLWLVQSVTASQDPMLVARARLSWKRIHYPKELVLWGLLPRDKAKYEKQWKC